MQANRWFPVRNQSLAGYMRNAGFDLAVYRDYAKDVRDEAKKRTIKKALAGIQDEFEDATQLELSLIKQGVYVISLASPLAIHYDGEDKWSQVIYIGMGNIIQRIESHFNNSLFDLMESLSGANFDFHFAIPYLKFHTDYYIHVEYLMLRHFQESFGEFPILNYNAGWDRRIDYCDDWWKQPLQRNGKRPLWALKRTKSNDFCLLDD